MHESSKEIVNIGMYILWNHSTRSPDTDYDAKPVRCVMVYALKLILQQDHPQYVQEGNSTVLRFSIVRLT